MIDPTDRPVYGPLHAPAPDEAPPRRRRAVLPWLIAALALALAVGLLTSPWFDRNIRSRLPGATPPATTEVAPPQARADTIDTRSFEPAAADAPRADAALATAVAQLSVETRLAALQAEIAELRARSDSSIAAAAQGADRAQTALLVGALRRAVDGGRRFDAYEPALRARFGISHSNEVAALLAFGRRPITAEALATALAARAPTIERAQAEGRSWWASLKTGLAGVVAVRRADAAATDPQAQLRAASARAAAGDVEGALRLAGALPASSRAALSTWTVDARRQAAAAQALTALEVAALAPAAVTVSAAPSTF